MLLVALVGAVRGLGIDAGAATDPARWSTVRLSESLVLIQAWLGHTDVWNAVSWSISLEWLAYLLFPAMVWVARRVGRLGPVGLALPLVAITAVPGSRAVMERLVPGTPSLPPLQIISEFLAGCVTYQLFRQQRGRTSLAAHPGWLLLALVVVASVMNHVGVPSACAVPLVPPLLLGLAYGEVRISRWFAHRAMVYGGKISFALYMTHYLWPKAHSQGLDLWLVHAGSEVITELLLDGAARPIRIGREILEQVPQLPPVGLATRRAPAPELPPGRYGILSTPAAVRERVEVRARICGATQVADLDPFGNRGPRFVCRCGGLGPNRDGSIPQAERYSREEREG